MDFFENQDRARRNTGLLVLYFVVAVLLMIGTVYAVAVVALGLLESDSRAVPTPGWWQPDILVAVAGGMLAVILLSSLWKIAEMRGGGARIAEALGGQRIHPNTADLAEQRLLNVVEEMAIASGIAVPPVYLLKKEEGINAFAAGYTPDDAVIGVNRGTIDLLSRDELQGVMAHEFSHILNGDMKINLRLIGILHGILVLAVIGYYVLRIGGVSRHRQSSGKKNGGGAAIFLIALALMLVGYIGLFFGRLIKAAVSRQREYLADAAAVQFTRNPDGIAVALKKIGGLAQGSQMETPEGETASHMFFGSAFRSWAHSPLATHPPLIERIQRIDPQFDGKFPPVHPVPPKRTKKQKKKAEFGFGERFGQADIGKPLPVDPLLILGSIGATAQPQMDYAATLLAALPEKLTEAAREPFGSRAVVYGLLLESDSQILHGQLKSIERHDGRPTRELTEQLAPLIANQSKAIRLPLIEIVHSPLTELSPEQYDRFRNTVVDLIQADKQIDLFEFVLQRLLIEQFDRKMKRTAPRKSHKNNSMMSVLSAAGTLLSTLAHAGQRGDQAVGATYDQAMRSLHATASKPPLLAQSECTPHRIGEVLDKLARVKPAIKKRILAAAIACVVADQHITIHEAELLRVVSVSLECPMPPIVASPLGHLLHNPGPNRRLESEAP